MELEPRCFNNTFSCWPIVQAQTEPPSQTNREKHVKENNNADDLRTYEGRREINQLDSNEIGGKSKALALKRRISNQVVNLKETLYGVECLMLHSPWTRNVLRVFCVVVPVSDRNG